MCLPDDPSPPRKAERSREDDKGLRVGVAFTPKRRHGARLRPELLAGWDQEKEVHDKTQADSCRVPLLGPLN